MKGGDRENKKWENWFIESTLVVEGSFRRRQAPPELTC